MAAISRVYDKALDVCNIRCYNGAYRNRKGYPMESKFCTECGTQLHNLFSGIVIVKRGNERERTVCAKCADKLCREGYIEQARAKGLRPLAS